MLHEDFAGGPSAMDVDHFDPRRKEDPQQDYENLFWACRHCNGKKGAFWPSDDLQSQGIRFLDCTKEADYGAHILENELTNELVGVTPAGKFHVRLMDLNAPHLVAIRRTRSEALKALAAAEAHFRNFPEEISDSRRIAEENYKMLLQIAEKLIPPIPFW